MIRPEIRARFLAVVERGRERAEREHLTRLRAAGARERREAGAASRTRSRAGDDE